MRKTNKNKHQSLRFMVYSSHLVENQSFPMMIDGEKLICNVKDKIVEVRRSRMSAHEDILYVLLQKLYSYDWNEFYHKNKKV